MALRIENKVNKKELKLRDQGEFKEELFRGAVAQDIDLSCENPTYLRDSINSTDGNSNNSKKVINIAKLFGSEKAAGVVVNRRHVKKENFSHRRIFGHKMKAATGEFEQTV